MEEDEEEVGFQTAQEQLQMAAHQVVKEAGRPQP